LIEAMNRRCGRAKQPRRLLPLSVKTRLGYETVVIERWVGHLLEEAPAAICIHGRTLEQMYRGEADWKAIERTARLFAGTPTLLLGNGDIGSLQEAVRRAEESRVHGALVGRATLGRPWFFRWKEAARRLFGRSEAGLNEDVLPEERPDLSERFRIMLDHAHRFESLFGVERFPRMRKHLGWYCKGYTHAAAMRASMVRASSCRDVEHILSAYRVSSTKASREGCASDRIDSTPSCR
jgi:tRNA-dihydrouridine synthase